MRNRYKIVILLGLMSVSYSIKAQEDSVKVDKPVRNSWDTGVLINHQTSSIPSARTLEMMINHRFGTVENGIHDVFGIMAPGANIRLGLNYSITDRIQVGFGTNSQKKYEDFQIKWNPIVQNRSNTKPLTVTLYGNMALDLRAEEVFGTNYQFTDRMCYFSEIIFGRKFNNAFSFQASANFSHYNTAEKTAEHDKIGLGGVAKFKFSPQGSIIVEYGQPLNLKFLSDQPDFSNASHPHASIGVEISTSGHDFQIFLTNSLAMVNQEMYTYNQEDFSVESIRFGFNITRLWGF